MKATVHGSRTVRGGISGHLVAMEAGLRRHGIEVVPQVEMDADFVVCWSWRTGQRIRQNGFNKPILVMERGYLGDRMNVWTSLGWDGLNGRARFPDAQDNGERFWRHHGHLAREWEMVDGYWLIIGQVLGDTALQHVDFNGWLRQTMGALGRLGADYRFRPHPEAVRRRQEFPVPQAIWHGGTLDEAFAGAAAVVTFNSNTGVEAVLAGVPTVTFDEGAMAWPVTSHSLFEPLVMPDRAEWFRDMAWRQWTLDEIASGAAWEVVRTAM